MLTPTTAYAAPPHSRDTLGRYYTHLDVSQLLVSQLGATEPRHVLDLGVGRGALAVAAISAFKRACLTTVDIDPLANRMLQTALHGIAAGRHRHVRTDALSVRLPQILRLDATEIDIAVCNPPFAAPVWRHGFESILESAGLSGCFPAIRDANAASLFLAQNLRLISIGGTIGIILPDSLMSAARFRQFRKTLLLNNTIKKAIRLPRGSFRGTDALAHILILEKSSVGTDSVSLHKFDDEGALSEGILVDRAAAETRLDFGFHASSCAAVGRRSRRFRVLGDVILDCRRGSFSSADVKTNKRFILHTTDVSAFGAGGWRRFDRMCNYGPNDSALANRTAAAPGDIVVARVGRHLEEQVVGVRSGRPLMSDCLFRVRLRREHQRSVLEALTSERGRRWLASRAFGVSAKQITKADLLAFPIGDL